MKKIISFLVYFCLSIVGVNGLLMTLSLFFVFCDHQTNPDQGTPAQGQDPAPVPYDSLYKKYDPEKIDGYMVFYKQLKPGTLDSTAKTFYRDDRIEVVVNNLYYEVPLDSQVNIKDLELLRPDSAGVNSGWPSWVPGERVVYLDSVATFPQIMKFPESGEYQIRVKVGFSCKTYSKYATPVGFKYINEIRPQDSILKKFVGLFE